jgi:hypothetical protein
MGSREELRRRCEESVRDVRASRERIELKAAALRQQLTPRELARPWTDPLKERLSGGGEKLFDAFKENPVPLGLVGIGLGWLILRDIGGARPAASHGDQGPGLGERAKETLGRVKEKVLGMKEKIGRKKDELSESVSGAARKAEDAGHGVSDWFSTTLEENPMLLAVGALAVGLALGVSLPPTKVEERIDGKIGERIAEKILEKGKELVEQHPAGATPSAAVREGGEGTPQA